MATTASVFMTSRHASSSSFSRNGSPTCTFGRFCLDSSVNPVAAGLGPHIDNRIPDTRSFGVENLILTANAQGEDVDQRIAVVARLEDGFAADRRHTETIAVVRDSRDDAFNDAPVARRHNGVRVG